MRLGAAANRFNQTPCTDGYTGKTLFSAQFSLYDDTKRDSEVGQRRVISISPEFPLPTRRVVTAMGLRWIIGHGNSDAYNGSAVRVGYVAHEATYLSKIRTLAEVCLDQAGRTAWVGRAWVKNLDDNENSSSLTPQFNIHFARSELVPDESLVTFDDRLFVVRTTHGGPAGTLIALCDQLPEPAIEVGSITSGVYDPVLETRVAGVTSVRVVRARWQSLFANRQDQAPAMAAGEILLAIAKASLTVTAGMKITLSDGVWFIKSPVSEGSVWLCRAARHA